MNVSECVRIVCMHVYVSTCCVSVCVCVLFKRELHCVPSSADVILREAHRIPL